LVNYQVSGPAMPDEIIKKETTQIWMPGVLTSCRTMLYLWQYYFKLLFEENFRKYVGKLKNINNERPTIACSLNHLAIKKEFGCQRTQLFEICKEKEN
jgi:hypothetical protein